MNLNKKHKVVDLLTILETYQKEHGPVEVGLELRQLIQIAYNGGASVQEIQKEVTRLKHKVMNLTEREYVKL